MRSAAKRMQCEANLRKLYVGLESYISTHGDLPRCKDGRVSIDSLYDPRVRKEMGIDSSVLRCPADESSEKPSYVLNPALTIQDLGRHSSTIVACDRIPRHLGVQTHEYVRVVLLGDGSIVKMDLPQKEQEAWYRLFSSGNKRACTVTAKDGVKGHWTSSNIAWYVGDADG